MEYSFVRPHKIDLVTYRPANLMVLAAGKDQPGLATRTAASELIHEVLFQHRYLDDAFFDIVRNHKLDHRDRALVRAIAATSVRRLGQIKAVLGNTMKKPLAPKFSLASSVLYTACAQILFLDVPDHSAIDLAVTQLRRHRKLHHLANMANAVLRKIPGLRGQVINAENVGRTNTPKWLWQLWAKDFGKDVADKISTAHLTEADLDISVKPTVSDLPGKLLPNGSWRLDAGFGRVENVHGFAQGDWWVQDVAASLPVHLMGNIKGKRIADLCAAPGGKTLQLAAGEGLISAVDISRQRLTKVEENLKRTGLAAEIVCADVLIWNPEEMFDGVLLDAPCSATGTIRRHPDALYLKKSSDIDTLCKLQKKLLVKAATLVKPGSVVVYCTCSLQKREGELQVENFLSGRDNFERIPVTPKEIGGMDHLIDENGDLRTLPFYNAGSGKGMDGFFISRLRRKT